MLSSGNTNEIIHAKFAGDHLACEKKFLVKPFNPTKIPKNRPTDRHAKSACPLPRFSQNNI
jgi:hypothetical protein